LDINTFIALALEEDINTGDHSTLSSIPADEKGTAILKIKEDGILAGTAVAQAIFHYLQPDAKFEFFKRDGESVQNGDLAFKVDASVHTILQAERLALNCMQRMSGIATLTQQYVKKIAPYNTKILDTRKTTPLFRQFEKEAVKIGGGHNHRMGLYDMIMLKDNHIDYCGGIEKAVKNAKKYILDNQLDLKIEVETRNIDEVKQAMAVGGVARVMFDNFSPDLMYKAVEIINKTIETEASGGINLQNIESYAATGVDFISIGALTHHAVSLDLSLKALK